MCAKRLHISVVIKKSWKLFNNYKHIPCGITNESIKWSTCYISLTSLHTIILPNTTCKPSKKLSPTMMTVAPPVVQPSLGLMALIHGVAGNKNEDKNHSIPGRINKMTL